MSTRGIGVPDITEEQAAKALADARKAAVGDNPNLEDMPFKSTAAVIESDVIDGHQFDSSFAAKAALSPSMSIAYKAVGAARTQEIRQEFEPFVDQLRSLRLTDTKVTLGKVRFEIPWNVNEHANQLPQKEAIVLLFKFIGRERTNELRKLAALSGQEDKPTLWLAQKLFIETKLSYVYQIRHDAKLKEAAATLNENQINLANEGIKNLFGNAIYEQFANIAQSNDLSPYAIFVILYHQIIDREKAFRKPVIASGLWDVLDQANEEFETYQATQEVA